MNSLFPTARPSHPLRRILGLTVLLSSLSSHPATAAQTTGLIKVKSITLGLVSGTSQKEIEAHFQEFVRYVARKLGAGPETEGKVVLARTPLQMAKLLEEKKVDFYMESPYPTYLINKQGAAMLLVRRWKNGMAEYRSLVFSKKSSATSQLGQLRGKMIAFEDPGSTSGYFLPKVLLLKKGFKLTEKANPVAKVGPNEIGYVFASTDANVVNLVLSGKVAAGAFSDDDYSALEGTKKADILILAQSDRFPRHLVSVRKDLDPGVKNRLKEVLLAMSQEDEGRRIMEQTDNTTKFDLLPGGEPQVRRKLVETFRGR
ncbi:MAG TPA: phosphate/phosphite/phosphonate ABC transporter substrate-binding protein [Candidatus Binatia bacterium]|jgi:phosphonate transport system substrate-binding protein